MADFSLNHLLSLLTQHRTASTPLDSYTLSLLTDVNPENPRTIMSLAALAFNSNSQIAAEAAKAIAILTKSFTAVDWYRLDAAARSHSTYLSAFPRVTPQSLRSLERFDDNHSLLLGLASMDGNGYVREEAVRRLAVLSNGELPFLIMRLNDWVPQVRQAAYDACLRKITPTYAGHYMAALPFVLRLAEARRNDASEFIKSVEDLLSRADCRWALLAGLSRRDLVTSRASFRLAFDSSGDDNIAAIFTQAFVSRDAVVRRHAAHVLRRRPAGDAVQKSFLERLNHDTLAAIRCEYLYLCHEKYRETSPMAMRNALLDRHPSVRSAARYYLRQSEATDFAQFYLAAISASDLHHLAPAIAGLGETGNTDDARTAAEFLRSPSSEVRRAAVTAVGRLHGEAFIPQLLFALSDVSTRVSRTARESLIHHVLSVPDELLWKTLVGATRKNERRNVLELMLALTKWRAGALLIRSAAWLGEQRQGHLVPEVTDFIERWLVMSNHIGLQATTEQISAIREASQTIRMLLPNHLVLRLDGIVRRAERLATH